MAQRALVEPDAANGTVGLSVPLLCLILKLQQPRLIICMLVTALRTIRANSVPNTRLHTGFQRRHEPNADHQQLIIAEKKYPIG
jgi:hypothetical protein